jgi:hypothetical protein
MTMNLTEPAQMSYVSADLSGKMAAFKSECGDYSCDLSQSPVFTDSTLHNLRSKETKGVPLQTPWTFWLDKYELFIIRNDLYLWFKGLHGLKFIILTYPARQAFCPISKFTVRCVIGTRLTPIILLF